jgi:hypothetical protein
VNGSVSSYVSEPDGQSRPGFNFSGKFQFSDVQKKKPAIEFSQNYPYNIIESCDA